MSSQSIQCFKLIALTLLPQVRDRADDPTIPGLSASMQAIGLQQPIRVRRFGERWVIVDGHRRYYAALLLGWEEIAAIVEDRELCDPEVIQRQLIANCQRKNLTGLEVARSIDELIRATGWSASETAAQLGFSNATVSKLLALLKLPEPVRSRVENGEIPASTAYELTRVKDGARQAEIADAAANGRLSREAVKQQTKSKSGSAARRKPSRLPTVIADLGNKRSVTVRGPGLDNIATLLAWLDETAASLRQALADGLGIEDLPKHFQALAKRTSA